MGQGTSATPREETGNAPDDEQQQQQHHHHLPGDSSEQHNASGHDTSSTPESTVNDTATASQQFPTSRPDVSPSPYGIVNDGELSSPSSLPIQDEAPDQHQEAASSAETTHSPADGSGDEHKQQNVSAQKNDDNDTDDGDESSTDAAARSATTASDEDEANFSAGEEDDSDDRWFGDTTSPSPTSSSASLPTSDDGDDNEKIVPREAYKVDDLASSIPPDTDIQFYPLTPTHNIIIINGPDSLYFGSFFRDCEFHGPVTFDNCVISTTTFAGCKFKQICNFKNVVFRDVTAVECVFNNSWHSNRTFKAGTHIGEVYVDDRAIDPKRQLPLDMRETKWVTSQQYGTAVSAPVPLNIDVSTLELAVIPDGADVSFTHIPNHGFSMSLGDAGLCRHATFKDCQFAGIKFINCVLVDVNFDGCSFRNVVFKDCVLLRTEFSECVMNGNTFANHRLEQVKLVRFTYTTKDDEVGQRMPLELASKRCLELKLKQYKDED